MQRNRVTRRRSNAWLWAITIILGVAIGVIGGQTYLLLRVSKTSVVDVFKRPFQGHRFVRILVLGEDNTSKSRSTGHGLSDTIMVAAIDVNNKTVQAVSIPRDTRAEIPGHGVQKINAANVFGGPELAMQTVEGVIGLPVEYYIKTDIAGLKNIVDLIGGVGIEIEKNMRYRDRRGGLYINLRKGYRHLDGDKALQYVRFRHDAMGDISRIQRQQKFLRALARHMLMPENWGRLPQVMNEVYTKGYIETNLNLKDLRQLVALARDVPPDQMVMETIPGEPRTIGGISYWVIDPVKSAEIVQRLLEFRQSASEPTAKVEVLNGSGIYGVAKEVADQLERCGYRVASTGNAPNFDYPRSRIILHNGKTESAVELAKLMRCTDIRTDPEDLANENGADITVIVGRDYR